MHMDKKREYDLQKTKNPVTLVFVHKRKAKRHI